MSRYQTGLLLATVASVAYGLVAIFAKLAYEAGATTGQTLTWRFISATALLILVLGIRGTRLTVTGGQLVRLFGLGAVGYFGQALTYFLALRFMPASLTALLLSLTPIVVAVMAWVIWRDPWTSAKLGALGLSITGGVLIIGSPASALDWRGVALAACCALLYATYLLIGNHFIGSVSRPVATIYIMGSATLAFIVYAAFTGGVWPIVDLDGWVAFFAMGLCTTVAMLGFFAGLQRLGPTPAAIVGTLEPAVTVVAAALILGELIGPLQVVGGVAVLGAVLILNLGASPARVPSRVRS